LFAAKKRAGDPDVYVDPGYSAIDLANDGTIRAFEFRTDKTVVAPPAAATSAAGGSTP
jgi:hypothetical protein